MPDSSSSARPETPKPSSAPSPITSKLFAGSVTRFRFPQPRCDFRRSGFQPFQQRSAPALPLQILLQKRADVIAGQEFERELAHGVVPARQNGDLVVPIPLLRRLNDVA